MYGKLDVARATHIGGIREGLIFFSLSPLDSQSSAIGGEYVK